MKRSGTINHSLKKAKLLSVLTFMPYYLWSPIYGKRDYAFYFGGS